MRDPMFVFHDDLIPADSDWALPLSLPGLLALACAPTDEAPLPARPDEAGWGWPEAPLLRPLADGSLEIQCPVTGTIVGLLTPQREG